jgi:hypothetical protein
MEQNPSARSQQEADKAWELPLGAGPALLGPLAWEEADGGHASRHASFSSERGLLCWDASGRMVVEVVDFAREQCWGERVLEVRERLPGRARGSRWDRPQSALVELAPDLQGAQAKAALGRVEPLEGERLTRELGQAWAARVEAEALEKEAVAGRASKPGARL